MAQFLKDEVKEKILNSAVQVFTDKGFQNASIKNIAKHAEVSVGNVYRYYRNKEALYSAVIQGVNDGVIEILMSIENNGYYKLIVRGDLDSQTIYEPMRMFVKLYKKEQKVFEMLLNNGIDQHYEKTISRIIDILKDYFYRFWGSEERGSGMSKIEISALTNAVVFSVIDLLNNTDEEKLDAQLMGFSARIIRGYFMASAMEEDYR